LEWEHDDHPDSDLDHRSAATGRVGVHGRPGFGWIRRSVSPICLTIGSVPLILTSGFYLDEPGED